MAVVCNTLFSIDVGSVKLNIPYFKNESEFNSFIKNLTIREKIVLKSMLKRKNYLFFKKIFEYLKYVQLIREEKNDKVNNLEYELSIEVDKIHRRKKYWIFNNTINEIMKGFNPECKKLKSKFKINKKIMIEELKKRSTLDKIEFKKLLNLNLDFLKSKDSKFMKLEMNSYKKDIFNELSLCGFEKIVKISDYSARMLNNRKEYLGKIRNIKSKEFLFNNFFTDQLIAWYEIYLQKQAFKKIIKIECDICTKLIKKEKILIDSLGNYHFSKDSESKEELNDLKEIYLNNLNEFKNNESSFKYTSWIDQYRKDLRIKKIHKYETLLKNWKFNKINWDNKLAYKNLNFKYNNLIQFHNEISVLEVKKDCELKKLKNQKISLFNYWKGFVLRWLKAKKIYFHELWIYKKDIRKKSFNYKSYKDDVYKFKKNWGNNFFDILYDDSYVAQKQLVISLNYDIKALNKKNKIVVDSVISDNYAQTPIRRNWMMKYLATILGFFLPGVGQFVNKQYLKGTAMLILIPIIILFLCYFFGLGNTVGDGIIGLATLGKIAKHSEWDNPDSRYFIVEGCIAVIFFVFALIIMLMSARDAWWNGVAMQKGSRCKRWIDTKKFLVSQGYPMMASFPAFVCIIFITFLPVISSVLLAFTNYSFDNMPPRDLLTWVKFDEFKELFSVKYRNTFVGVLEWTVIWTIVTSLLSIIIGFFYAILLNSKKIVFKSFFRVIFLIPWAIPGFISILFFKELFLPTGTLSQLFHQYNWYYDGTLSKIMLLMVNTWLFHTTTFLMATGLMQSISPDLYEAAKIDGASNVKQSFKITLPLLLSAMAPILIGAFVGGFNSFGIIFMLTDGAPDFNNVSPIAGQTDTLVSVVYKLVRQSNLGLASALNVILVLFIILIPGWAIARTKTVKGDAL